MKRVETKRKKLQQTLHSEKGPKGPRLWSNEIVHMAPKRVGGGVDLLIVQISKKKNEVMRPLYLSKWEKHWRAKTE